ncbi:hypothetical protein GCM10022197_00790 [Microlunatus spumicola]|uniref:Tryptophan-associated transmembrane protein (Trp_oprn_chp) n=1 Tax=Microlunatus spumicola TaxID=81499 RepID=A0ABP6WFE6_9ACTN
MVSGRKTGLTALLGVLVVVVGLVVLRSPAAQAGIGWFSYGGPPSPEVLASLLPWNLPRAVGAALVLVGVAVLAHLLGSVAARRGLVPPRAAGRVLVLAVLFVVGGAVAFVAGTGARATDVTYGSSAWTQSQTAAALVVATGLVVAAVAAGLRRVNAP